MEAMEALSTGFVLSDTATGLLCTLSGRLDTERCAHISESLVERLRASRKPVTFDLSEVGFVASAFLRLCIIATRAVGSGNVTLANTSPAIKRVFKIAGLDGPIRIL